MSYQALYRVWRPQTFEDMVGQELIAKTLQNAVETEKISHAYLFAGPRGTGKTSAAKIFAKAINCPHQVNGQPCNTCELCQSATQGMLSDIIEIDAASNNGVDEIRDIRDKSRYAPTQARYKVYIIDEVHMLSIGAFNALLKTLEEPTQNVIFILATTEVHKIPATILSRVQRYDFKRISQQDIENRLAFILNAQNQEYEKEALSVIARVANGGMRDGLSLLDQALSYANGKLTLEIANLVTGTFHQDDLVDYLIALHQTDAQRAITQLHTLLDEGKTASRFVEELLTFIKEVLLGRFQNSTSDNKLLDAIENAWFYRVMDSLVQTQQQLKQNVQQDLYVEVMSIKLAQLPSVSAVDDSVVNSLLTRINELENRLLQLEQEPKVIKATTTVTTPVATSTRQQKDFEVNKTQVFQVLSNATRVDKDKLTDEWYDILSCLNVQQRAKLKGATILAASQQAVVLGFEYDLVCGLTSTDDALQQEISTHAMRLINHPCELVCVPMRQWQEVRQEFLTAKQNKAVDEPVNLPEALVEDQVQEEKNNDPFVQQAIELFGDLVEVTEEN